MRKKSKLGKIIIIIVIIAVIGGIFGGRKDKDKTPAPSGSTNIVTPSGSGQSSNRIGSDTTTNTTPAQPANTVPEQNTTQAENTQTNTANTTEPAKDGNYISPDLKAFLQSYEAFMDEYCEFMENYNSSDATQLLKYASLMQKYSDFAKKADAYDESTMTDAESIYYAEVLNRISIKLLKAQQNMKK